MTERMVNVAIYAGPASTEGMRDKAGVRSQIRDVSFTTGLPGGFLEASFTVSAPISEPTAIIAGQKVIIRRGRVIVWFGWIEDIKRTVRGRTLELQVTCFGPWQEIVQRLVPELSYASMQGDAAIKKEMALFCPSISLDHTQIDSTGVDIGPINAVDVRYKSMADLVSLVCDAGDSSNRRVLFAVWEPSTANPGLSSHAGNILTGSDFENPYGVVWGITDQTNGAYALNVTKYVSPVQSGKMYSTDSSAIGHVRLENAHVYAIASQEYRFEYSIHFPAMTGINAWVEVNWYNILNNLISTSTGATKASTGTAGWNNFVSGFTSPVGAVYLTAFLYAEWPATPTAVKEIYWDDCYLAPMATSEAPGTKPRAALWSRDLSTYDYILRTSLLEQTIEDSASTRDLINAGVADYGSLGSDVWAYNTASIATYRQRDRLMNEYPLVFSPSLVAQAMATYLALWANPVIDIGGFSLSRPGAITTKKGRLVELSDVRAGDRLLLNDGPRAGTVIMLASTSWSNGVLSCTPESDYSLVKLVADIYNVVYPNGPL